MALYFLSMFLLKSPLKIIVIENLCSSWQMENANTFLEPTLATQKAYVKMRKVHVKGTRTMSVISLWWPVF